MSLPLQLKVWLWNCEPISVSPSKEVTNSFYQYLHFVKECYDANSKQKHSRAANPIHHKSVKSTVKK